MASMSTIMAFICPLLDSISTITASAKLSEPLQAQHYHGTTISSVSTVRESLQAFPRPLFCLHFVKKSQNRCIL